eukprot:m.142119 g.142119  ORF g.142119 m.142119 type:complete len:88 (-) comp14967_c0_seq1:526-789(-)
MGNGAGRGQQGEVRHLFRTTRSFVPWLVLIQLFTKLYSSLFPTLPLFSKGPEHLLCLSQNVAHLWEHPVLQCTRGSQLSLSWFGART